MNFTKKNGKLFFFFEIDKNHCAIILVKVLAIYTFKIVYVCDINNYYCSSLGKKKFLFPGK